MLLRAVLPYMLDALLLATVTTPIATLPFDCFLMLRRALTPSAYAFIILIAALPLRSPMMAMMRMPPAYFRAAAAAICRFDGCLITRAARLLRHAVVVILICVYMLPRRAPNMPRVLRYAPFCCRCLPSMRYARSLSCLFVAMASRDIRLCFAPHDIRSTAAIAHAAVYRYANMLMLPRQL